MPAQRNGSLTLFLSPPNPLQYGKFMSLRLLKSIHSNGVPPEKINLPYASFATLFNCDWLSRVQSKSAPTDCSESMALVSPFGNTGDSIKCIFIGNAGVAISLLRKDGSGHSISIDIGKRFSGFQAILSNSNYFVSGRFLFNHATISFGKDGKSILAPKSLHILASNSENGHSAAFQRIYDLPEEQPRIVLAHY